MHPTTPIIPTTPPCQVADVTHPASLWLSYQIPPSFFLGAESGMAGTLANGTVHVHCGGIDRRHETNTRECFAIAATPEGSPLIQQLAPLPVPLRDACTGSDGQRIVLAGGLNTETGRYTNEVYVLEEVGGEWRKLRGKLPRHSQAHAGVLLGDYLVCFGGSVMKVRGSCWVWELLGLGWEKEWGLRLLPAGYEGGGGLQVLFLLGGGRA